MGEILNNPIIARTQNIGAPLVLYLGDDFAIFGCINSPEGLIQAGKRSIAISQNQGIFWKSTDHDITTGWMQILYSTIAGAVTGAGLQAQIPLIQEANFTQVGNIGAGEDNISTFTIPANVMSVDGDMISFDIAGGTAANANNKTIRARFPTGTIFFDTGALPVADKDWTLRCRIMRQSNTTARGVLDFSYQDGGLISAADNALTGLDFTTSQLFRVTGESAAAASNDVFANYRSVVLYKAPV